jgi:radical SAM protein with 4Fe4S-binding SPASM domain
VKIELPEIFTAVEIEINSHCNLSCSYCPNNEYKRIETGSMSKELYYKIIADLKEIGFQGRISYDFYNEPTLCKNLVHFVEYTKQQLPKVRIVLYSNGTLLNDQLFNQLESAGVDRYIITKHEEVEDYIFETTYSLLSDQQKEKVMYKHNSEIEKYNRGGLLDHIGDKIKNLTPCYIPSWLISITNKGTVLPCFEDFFQELAMGDCNKQSLKDIWYSDKFVSFRKELKMGLRQKYGPCKDCNRLRVLPGGSEYN